MMVDVVERLRRGLGERHELPDGAGRGAMGFVYRARDLRHERFVAIKVLPPELSASIGIERFLVEVRITAQLQHPNIVPLFDSSTVDGLVYFVMPFLGGPTLAQRIATDGPLPVEEA